MVSLESEFIFTLEVIYVCKHAVRIQVTFNWWLIIHSLNGTYQASESLKGRSFHSVQAVPHFPPRQRFGNYRISRANSA